MTTKITEGLIEDGAVSSAKLAAEAVTFAKMARQGTVGQIMTSGGPSADPTMEDPPGGGKLIGRARTTFNQSSTVSTTAVVAATGRDTAYLSSEGTAFTPTVSYTPQSLSNSLRFSITSSFNQGASNRADLALFYNTETEAEWVWSFFDTAPDVLVTKHFEMPVPVLVSMEFKLRLSTSWSGSAFIIHPQPLTTKDWGASYTGWLLVEEFAP